MVDGADNPEGAVCPVFTVGDTATGLDRECLLGLGIVDRRFEWVRFFEVVARCCVRGFMDIPPARIYLPVRGYYELT